MMPVKRRISKSRAAELSELQYAFLTDTINDHIRAESDSLELLELETGEDPGNRSALWSEYRDAILKIWVKTKPGTRPSLWWFYDAPRQPVGTYPGWYYDGRLPQPRMRLGGIGSALHDVLAYAPRFVLGLPANGWLSQRQVEFYNGRAVDIRGKPIGLKRATGDSFVGEAFDPSDPPFFESEAAYLDRHGLMSAAERRMLPKGAYAPYRFD